MSTSLAHNNPYMAVLGLKLGWVIQVTFCPGQVVYKISRSDSDFALDHVR